jgi:proline dehydrogenase
MQKVLLKLAKRWIAGEHRNDAIDHAIRLNRKGIKATINYVGEHAKDMGSVEGATAEYVKLIKEIQKTGVNASISIKLTEIGLDYSEKLCKRELKEILSAAEKARVFVWVDMEGHQYTQKTVELYHHILPIYPAVGITIQTSLKRSTKDITALLKLNTARIRLVKGAYREPAHVAVSEKNEVKKNFQAAVHQVFASRQYCAIATHDTPIIEQTRVFGKRDNFEFQMLMGVKNKLKERLVKQRSIVTEYVPYGTNWKAYVKRRLLDRKANILYAAASLFA